MEKLSAVGESPIFMPSDDVIRLVIITKKVDFVESGAFVVRTQGGGQVTRRRGLEIL